MGCLPSMDSMGPWKARMEGTAAYSILCGVYGQEAVSAKS